MPYANDKGADQTAHPCSLIITFVIRYLGSIPTLAKSKISRLWLVSVAEQAGLSLTWSETSNTGFLMTRLIYQQLETAMPWPRALGRRQYELRHETTCLWDFPPGTTQTCLLS